MIDTKKMAKFFDEKFQMAENVNYEMELCAFYVECKKQPKMPIIWFGDIGLPDWGFYDGYIWGVQPVGGNTSIIIDPELNVVMRESHQNMFAYSEEDFIAKIKQIKKESY